MVDFARGNNGGWKDSYDNDDEENEPAQNIDKQHIANMLQIQLLARDLEQGLLAQAREVCEKSWGWRFLKDSKKNKRILKQFIRMKRIIEIEEE